MATVGTNGTLMGIATGFILPEGGLTNTQINSFISFMQGLNLQFARFDFDWSAIEGGGTVGQGIGGRPGTPNYGVWDNLVNLLNQANIQIIGCLDFTPAWAADPAWGTGYSNKVAPYAAAGGDQWYANFCAQTATRYKNAACPNGQKGILAWEVWNEQNNNIFWKDTPTNPNPNPTHYCNVLNLSYQAIKGADPTAIVISGGLASLGAAPNDFVTWTQAILNNAKNSFDHFGVHPYSFHVDYNTGSPESLGPLVSISTNPYYQVFERAGAPFPTGSVDGVIALLDKSGRSPVPQVWATECGAPSFGKDPTSNPNTFGPGTNSSQDTWPSINRQASLVDEYLNKWLSLNTTNGGWGADGVGMRRSNGNGGAGPIAFYNHFNVTYSDTNRDSNFGFEWFNNTSPQIESASLRKPSYTHYQTISNKALDGASSGTIPSNTSVPVVQAPFLGLYVPGISITVNTGNWSANPPITSYGYQWYRCNSTGQFIVKIPGATANSYVIQNEDLGWFLGCLVGATNTAGTGFAIATPYIGTGYV